MVAGESRQVPCVTVRIRTCSTVNTNLVSETSQEYGLNSTERLHLTDHVQQLPVQVAAAGVTPRIYLKWYWME